MKYLKAGAVTCGIFAVGVAISVGLDAIGKRFPLVPLALLVLVVACVFRISVQAFDA